MSNDLVRYTSKQTNSKNSEVEEELQCKFVQLSSCHSRKMLQIHSVMPNALQDSSRGWCPLSQSLLLTHIQWFIFCIRTKCPIWNYPQQLSVSCHHQVKPNSVFLILFNHDCFKRSVPSLYFKELIQIKHWMWENNHQMFLYSKIRLPELLPSAEPKVLELLL